MFGSAIIDIAIGLVFVYLVLSLVVTAAQEVLETIIKLRGAHLAKGIEKLLGAARAKEFFASAAVAALSPDRWLGAGTRKPSYIPSRTFAMVVLDMIVPATAAAPRCSGRSRPSRTPTSGRRSPRGWTAPRRSIRCRRGCRSGSTIRWIG
jgi:hypothetical protein